MIQGKQRAFCLWSSRNHVYNKDPASSASGLCQAQAFKAVSPSVSLLSPFWGHFFMFSLPQPLLWWTGSDGTCVTVKGMFIFTSIKNSGRKTLTESKVVRLITLLQLLTCPLCSSLGLLTWSLSPEATLTWLQSWTVTTPLRYQNLLPAKSLVLACAHKCQCTILHVGLLF